MEKHPNVEFLQKTMIPRQKEKFRVHIVGLAHLPVNGKYAGCAFTCKAVKMARMLMEQGHEVYVYGAEGGDVPCTEYIETHTLEDIAREWGDGDNRFDIGYDWRKGMFRHDINKTRSKTTQKFIDNAIKEINKRKQPDDFLMIMQGQYNKDIADAVDLFLTMEPGIGYRGSVPRLSSGKTVYRGFESSYIMNFTYGRENAQTGDTPNGAYYDRVFPNYFEKEDFTFREKKQDYFFYIGRLIYRKGVKTAIETAKALNTKIYIAGQLDDSEKIDMSDPLVEYIGYVDPEKRTEMMANAKACFIPTYYLEPFGGTNVESQLCFTAETEVEANNILRTYKRRYSGKLMQLETKVGKIECTPNHPFLTSRGWVQADELTNTDFLCYNSNYEQRGIYRKRIKDIVEELSEEGAKRDGEIIKQERGVGRVKGYEDGTIKKMEGQDSLQGFKTVRNRVGLPGWFYRRGWLDNITKSWKQEEQKTTDSFVQYVSRIYGLLKETYTTSKLLYAYKKSGDWLWKGDKKEYLYLCDNGTGVLPFIQKAVTVPSYKEATNGDTFGVDRAEVKLNKTREAQAEANSFRENDAFYEFTPIKDIRSRQVKNIQVYNLGTSTGTYEANGYLVHNCGTPVLTTDFGAFLDTVVQGVTGFRCHTLSDFIECAKLVDTLNPKEIRKHAERYLTDNMQWELEDWMRELYQVYLSATVPGVKGWHYVRDIIK